MEVSDFASVKPRCVGPNCAHEFQRLVRNYLFCWTLAGINHPLGGWCQLRASVMQKGYFKHCLTPSASLSCLPPFTLTLLTGTTWATFSFKGTLPLEVQGWDETNVPCPFLQRNTGNQMISHHLTCSRSGAHHCLCLLSHAVLPGAPFYCSTAARVLAEDHVESCHSSA